MVDEAAKGEICNEEVRPGSDYTSSSVLRNQVPGRHKVDFKFEGFVNYTAVDKPLNNTDLRPFNNNPQRIKHRFFRVDFHKGF